MNRTLHILILIGILLCSPARPISAQSGVTFREDADFLYLENDAVQFTFSKVFKGGIDGIIDRASDFDFHADSLPAALFNLTAAQPDGSTQDISNHNSSTFTYWGEAISGGTRLTLTYTNLDNRALTVVATIALFDDDPRAEWRIAIQNDDPTLVLSNVAYPLIFGLSPVGDPGDDALAFPQSDGILLHNPMGALNTGDGFFATYPSDLSLQMMAYYDLSVGLYFAAHDRPGQPKTFAYAPLPWEGGAVTLVTINHTLPEEAGYDFAPDYPVVLGPFHGDWYDAAMIYKAWAVQQPWLPSRFAERTDVPNWWKAAPPIISAASYTDQGYAALPAEKMPARAREYAEALGLPVTLLTWGWEKHGAWTGPDYFPPRDGDESFHAATEALHADSNHKFVYVSGTVWRLTRKELPNFDNSTRFEVKGRPHAALQRDGEPFFDPFYSSIGWQAVRMCPATAYWQDTVVSSVVGAAELGIDAVSVDEFPIGSIYPCYATDHGHPPGSGPWQAAAYRAILERARAEGRAINPDLALTSEQPNEFYLDLLDGYVSRDNRPDWIIYSSYLRRFGGQFETIPLFSAVYHEVILTFAEPTPLSNPGLDIDRLRTSYSRSIASALVRGKIPAAGVEEIGKADPQLLDLFRRVAQATSGYAHDYAILGEMLRPPQIDVPQVSFDWLDVDIVSGEVQYRQASAPAVLAGAWRSPAGHVGYSLANITDQAQRFDLPLATEGLNGPYLVYAVRDGGYEVLCEGNSLPPTVEIDLSPWGVGLVAIVPSESEEAARVHAQPSATPTPPPTPTPASSPGACGGAALLPLAAALALRWFLEDRKPAQV